MHSSDRVVFEYLESGTRPNVTELLKSFASDVNLTLKPRNTRDLPLIIQRLPESRESMHVIQTRLQRNLEMAFHQRARRWFRRNGCREGTANSYNGCYAENSPHPSFEAQFNHPPKKQH